MSEMAQFPIGFVYVFVNQAMPGIVKIGQTSKLSEDRAEDLSKTSVPYAFEVTFRALTSDPKGLEKAVHEHLEPYRVNPKREFFNLASNVAIDAILEIRKKIDGIENWSQRSPLVLKVGDRLSLSLHAGEIFAISGYPNPFSEEADVIDVWQAHTDGDTLELYCVEESEYTRGFSNDEPFSTEDPVPFLNRTQTVHNNIIIGQERLVPGNRLLWMGNCESGDFVSVIFEFHCHCQAIARTSEPQFIESGYPLLLNMITYTEMPESMIEAGRDFLHLPRPRTWAPQNPDVQEGWSDIAQKKADASFWMPQLNKKSNKKSK